MLFIHILPTFLIMIDLYNEFHYFYICDFDLLLDKVSSGFEFQL